MKKLSVLALVLVILIPFEASAGDRVERESCEVCGMYIDSFKDTSGTLEFKDGRKLATCGVACTVRLVNDQGGPGAFTTIMVRDWNTKKLVSASEAVYVIGSKIIPDMIPNLIAFAGKEDAEAFKAKEGGELINFTQALLSISPTGMTMPTRLKGAVLPPKGVVGVGVGYMMMTMDEVMRGSDDVDPKDFVKRPMQMMGPKKMETRAEMLMAQYGLTDDLTLNLKVPYLDKEMEMYTMSGNAVTKKKNSGVGDIDLSLRYGLWKNTFYSKFFSLLIGTTLPTGEFETEHIGSPGLQLGTGSFTGTAGLVFSNRVSNFWFHYLLSHTFRFENSDDYEFGDVTRFGAAIHYTPNYDFLFGLEVDGADFASNEFEGHEVGNTGGFRSYLTGVTSWRFLTALGGNFNLRIAAGVPIYEDMDHYTMGSMEKVQLGGGYFANAMISFKRRFPMY
jgi:nitrous oxide reductase accessory protein NosL